MLASGMDEATAYQYLQQLCGVAGKGSKLTLKIPYLQNPSQKCCTAISLLISTNPHTTYLPFYKTCQRARNVNCVLRFSYLALLLLAPALYFNSVQPMQLLPVPRSLLKSELPTETLCNVGGAVSFRTAEESVENAKEILNAFDRAILKHKNRPKIEVPERKLPPPTSCLSFNLVSFCFPLYLLSIRQR